MESIVEPRTTYFTSEALQINQGLLRFEILEEKVNSKKGPVTSYKLLSQTRACKVFALAATE
jgi:hypothetical protein